MINRQYRKKLGAGTASNVIKLAMRQGLKFTQKRQASARIRIYEWMDPAALVIPIS